MKNEIKPITPADAGLSLAVIAGPRGSVQDDWPCIEYICELLNSRRAVIWRGEYRLGVGHVNIGQYKAPRNALPGDKVQNMLWNWQQKPHAQWINKGLWADGAAWLAKAQKVAPALNDVCYSLLMDGAAFFDGLRFEEWVVEFGYSADSIKAKETFEACDKIGRDLARSLSRDELAGLREWASNY